MCKFQPQLDKTKCIFTALLLLTSCTSEAHSSQSNKEKALITIDSLVNRETLGCSFNSSSEYLVDFYNDLLNQSTTRVDQTSFNIGNSYHITGVKNISNIYKKELNERSVNMDTNFKKYGVWVLRISSYSIDGEYEEFGYYIILKGSPTLNQNILKQHEIKTNYANVEKTKGDNTRVRCTLVG